LLRETQPRVSDLLRGRIDLFSTDSLIDALARCGVGVRLVVKPSRSYFAERAAKGDTTSRERFRSSDALARAIRR